ncbi:DUF2281 domain-containing protein [Rhodohalobacter sp. 8-1]|uniref:DUF2281 domain-containing protein n=1 Tax=Rhodohalobacter sp. 8-1 TaxID=3131972 RepID=UPI0030EE2DBE
MNESKVSEKIEKLPPDAKQQARDFVDFLYERYVEGGKKSSKKSNLESSFFGMWKDREDMEDSTEWVRKVRKSQ